MHTCGQTCGQRWTARRVLWTTNDKSVDEGTTKIDRPQALGLVHSRGYHAVHIEKPHLTCRYAVRPQDSQLL